MFVVASGLYDDVWTNWVELALNLAVTFTLAPHYGIIGILLGKIISVFFFQIFWKPYYLFSRGFHDSVWVYWRGMAPYFILFFLFTAIAIALKLLFIDTITPSWPSLMGLGITTFLPLLVLYFLSMFVFTQGMKHFIIRIPLLYRIICKLTRMS